MPADRDDSDDSPADASADGEAGDGGPDDSSVDAGGGDSALGAAWGGTVEDDEPGGDRGSTGDSGPLPRAEEIRNRNATGGGGSTPPHEISLLDRITIVLQDHKTPFTVALLLYALLVMPWLYGNGLELLGLLGGVVFLGGVVLLTVANVHKARSALRGDERRGF